MAQQTLPNAGYKGKITLQELPNGLVLMYPYSNSSVVERRDVITPSVNGFPGQIGITLGAKIREGGISMPVLGVAMLQTLLGFFKSETARNKRYEIAIDSGFNVQKFQCYMKSLSISADPGQGVNAELGIIGGVVDVGDINPTKYEAGNATWTPNGTFFNSYIGLSHIPFYKTNVISANDDGLASSGNLWRLVSGWSFSVDNNTGSAMVTAMGGNDDAGYKLHQGQQVGEGKITLLNPFVNSDNSNLPDWSKLNITVTDVANASTIITLFRCINHAYGVQLPDPNTRITQSISFTLTTSSDSSVDHILFNYT